MRGGGGCHEAVLKGRQSLSKHWGLNVENNRARRMFGRRRCREFRKPMILIYDTETTGLPRDWNAPSPTATIGLVWSSWRGNCTTLRANSCPVATASCSLTGSRFRSTPPRFTESPPPVRKRGLPLDQVMEEFMADAAQATYVMGHNIGFDVNVAGAELVRLGKRPRV